MAKSPFASICSIIVFGLFHFVATLQDAPSLPEDSSNDSARNETDRSFLVPLEGPPEVPLGPTKTTNHIFAHFFVPWMILGMIVIGAFIYCVYRKHVRVDPADREVTFRRDPVAPDHPEGREHIHHRRVHESKEPGEEREDPGEEPENPPPVHL